MAEKGNNKGSEFYEHDTEHSKSLLNQLMSISSGDSECGAKARTGAQEEFLGVQNKRKQHHKPDGCLVQEIDCSEAGKKASRALEGERGPELHPIRNISGGDGTHWDAEITEGKLLLKVQLLRVGEASAGDVDIETVDNGRGLIIQMPGCTDLHVAVPGFAYEATRAQRKKHKSVLLVTVPAGG